MCGEREAEGNLTRNTSLTPPHSVPSQQKIDTSRLAFEDMECHICNFNAWATRATITQLHKKHEERTLLRDFQHWRHFTKKHRAAIWGLKITSALETFRWIIAREQVVDNSEMNPVAFMSEILFQEIFLRKMICLIVLHGKDRNKVKCSTTAMLLWK